MTTTLDHHEINHMTVAVCQEMTPISGRQADSDTLFMGGRSPSLAEEDALGRFAQDKNYKVIYNSFDPSETARGPTEFRAVVTDGVAETIILTQGRLWKAHQGSAAVLLFQGARIVVNMSSEGRLTVGAMAERYHDHGYGLAMASVRARASHRPGHGAVVAPVGTLVTVTDLRRFADTFAVAA